MSLFGRWEDLSHFQSIQDVIRHFGLPAAAWRAWQTEVGDLHDDLRILSALSRPGLVAACGAAKYQDGSGLSPATATQIGLIWRLSRRIMAAAGGMTEDQFMDIDPWSEPTPASRSNSSTPSAGSGVKERVLKMCNLIDQSDDSELLPPSTQEVNIWLQNYVAVMGAAPQEAEEPSPSQLAGLSKRVFRDGGPPYVDFGVYGPYERKLAKTLKCRVFTPLGDGSFLQKELPGPPTYQAWLASWRVFRTSCLMLDIVNLAALEVYGKHVEKLVLQWPSCWGLIYAADDLARAERLEKLRRRFTVEAGLGRQVPRDWNEAKPWSCLFTELTKDESFWSEKVHIPASAWVAAGSRGSPVVASEASVKAHIQGVQDSVENLPEANDSRAKKRRFQSDMNELKTFRQNKRPGDKDPGQSSAKGSGKGKGKTKDQAGSPLCFSWASGSGPCASVPPGGECLCPVKRVHKCRKCLSPTHQDDACSK